MEQKDVLINRANTIINETQYFANDGPRVGGLIKDIVEYADDVSSGQISLGRVANLAELYTPNIETGDRATPQKGDRWIVLDQINPDNNLPYYFVYKGNSAGQTGNIAANWANTGETIMNADAATHNDLSLKADKATIFNVSQYNNQYDYADATTARNAVPSELRGRGQLITYSLSSRAWVLERFVGTGISTWGIEGYWKAIPDDKRWLKKEDVEYHTTELSIINAIKKVRIVNDLYPNEEYKLSHLYTQDASQNYRISFANANSSQYLATTAFPSGKPVNPVIVPIVGGSGNNYVELYIDYDQLPNSVKYENTRIKIQKTFTSTYDYTPAIPDVSLNTIGSSKASAVNQDAFSIHIVKPFFKVLNTMDTNTRKVADAYKMLRLYNDPAPLKEYKVWVVCGYIAAYPFRVAIADSTNKVVAQRDFNNIASGNYPPNRFTIPFINSSDAYFDAIVDWSLIPTGLYINGGNSLYINKANCFSGTVDLSSIISINQINKNFRFSFIGSSVTWDAGWLQTSYLEYLIPMLQKTKTQFIGINDASISATNIALLNTANDRLFFDKQAKRIEGVGATIDFDITGDEISIVQGIDRVNDAASLIDVYVDGVLFDTISNYNNEPIGHETKTFTALANQKEFPLERPFTYNHVVKVNGVAQTVILNKGMSMPSSGFAVARDIQIVNGKAIVQHTLFSVNALNVGDIVTCEYDYGTELRYEKTTIGKDGNGILESAYGRGYTPFDPANPGTAAFGSGLDFRQTDERVIKKYTFNESKSRHVQLKIRGLDSRAVSGSTPYFIFNFATNRILYFQNAGIGGWTSARLDNEIYPNDDNVLKTWKEVCDFQPDIVYFETTPNDDWSTGGYRVYTANTLTLAQMQNVRLMPTKRIVYQSATDNYLYERQAGKITAIDKWSVSFEGQIATQPKVGDSVVIGTYFSNNKEYVARLVRSYNADTKTITFDRPISKRDYILNELSDFIGKDIQIRDLAYFSETAENVIKKLKEYNSDAEVGIIPNPMPNVNARNLSAYAPYMIGLKKSGGVDFTELLENVYNWQMSQVRDKQTTVNALSLTTDYRGYKVADLTGLPKGANYQNYDILVDGVSIYGNGAFVENGYGYVTRPDKSGVGLNTNYIRDDNVMSLTASYPRIVFTKNAPTNGTITVKASSSIWSNDSCHMNNENGKKLFANKLNKTL